MKSIAFGIISNVVVLISLSFFLAACDNKAKEFDSRCQGWEDELALSHMIYDKLNGYTFSRYLALKTGTDRATYSFSFLGQTNDTGILIHSDGVNLHAVTVDLESVNKAFDLLPKDKNSLQGYTGDGKIWSHLSCAYMSIYTKGYSNKLSFHDYILKQSLEEPVSHTGVATLVRLKNYFSDELLKPTSQKLRNKITIQVEKIPELDADVMKTMQVIRNSNPVFYEIPD